MSWRAIRTVFGKEMRETLRDKRTLAAMIGIPVLLYPLLALGVSQLVAMQLAAMQKERTRLTVLGDRDRLLAPLAGDPRLDAGEGLFSTQAPEEAVKKLKDGGLDAVLVVVPQPGRPGNVKVRLLYNITEDRSRLARDRLTEMLRRITVKGIGERLARREKGLALHHLAPMLVAVENVNPQLQGAFVFGRMIALLLVLLAVTFPFHPALDLAAGEKERGTLETLLVSPAGRSEIVLGKYLAVFAVGMLGSVLNLASMALTFGQFAGMTKNMAEAQRELEDRDTRADEKLGEAFFFHAEEREPSFDFGIGAGGVARILLALVPLIGLFSAVSLLLSTLARSYKEGQHYLTPLLVAVMPLSMVAMIPDLHLSAANAWIPVSNVVLVVKDLFVEKLSGAAFALALGSTAVYAGLALWATVWVCGKEEVLFREVGSQGFRLRPAKPAETPTVGTALAAWALALILVGWIVPRIQLRLAGPRSFLIVTAAGLLLIALLAAGATWWGRARWVDTLALRRPRVAPLLTGLGMGAGGAMLALPLLDQVVNRWFPGLKEMLEGMGRGMLEGMAGAPGWALFLCIALLPALCEELFFRGLVQQSLARKVPAAAAVVGAAALFALAHVSFVRWAPTFCIGLLAGWAVLRTGTVLLGSAVHLGWNGSIVALTLWARSHPTAASLPGWWVPGGALLWSAGLLGFLAATRGRPAAPAQ